MLEALVSDLQRKTPLQRSTADMGRLLSAIATAGARLPELPRRAAGYSRTRLYGDERFEVLLLDWTAGSASPIHDHGGQHCWLAVLEGAVRIDDFERVDSGETPGYARLEATGSFDIRRGGLDLRSGAFDIHRVAAERHALTLHVYARPLQKFLIYDQIAQRCSSAAGTYDRVLTPLEFAPAG